jgi:predicted HTH transcriptional regulator
MLLKLHDYIRREGVVSNQQLARAFQIDADTLQPMLTQWVHKGVIEQCVQPGGCQQACFKCQQPPEYYRYLAAK